VITRSRLRPIVGEQIRLRPFQGRDLSRVITWRRDGELRRGALWGEGVFGPREARRWLRAVTDAGDSARLTFAVELRASGRLVGLTNLIRIDRASGTAYFGVVIGEKDCWGRGVGGETLRLMLGRAAALGLRKVLLEVAADNPRAIELYRRVGFVTEGVLRRQLVRPDGAIDVLVMAYFLEER
jgi:RimJ/RimL family protein N-acetyltransferase